VDRLRFWLDPKWFCDPVVSLEKGEAPVADFTIPDGHEFVSGGFISHNTTSLRAVVRILQEAGVPFLLCAPTGIAAKNLSNLTGAHAYTIHRAFAARGIRDKKRDFTYTGVVGDAQGSVGKLGQDEFWEYGPDNPHPAEVIVVDETSMLDQHLVYRLLTCTSPQCRMVIVGDAAQLPSVGPGNVLRDLIASDQFPVVNLTKIFRQKDTSDIIYAAHAIYRGEVPNYTPPSDFSLVQISSEDEVLAVILRLAEKLYGQRRNFQILSPRHAGVVGVTNLNANLRELLNPHRAGLQETRLMGDMFREDDRIMIVRNNYKFGVYNGDVGKISRIDRKAEEVELKIFGNPPLFISVPFRDVPKFVRMAYACTVHKCVVGSTLIRTEGGLRRIDAMVEGSHRRGVIPAKHSVAGRKGWVETDQIFVGGRESTIRVTTRLGYSLEGSYRHPLLVVTGNGEQVWKNLPTVEMGDTLVLRRGVGTDIEYRSTSAFQPNFGRNRHGSIPTVVTEDLAWLLGVLVGDGDVTDEVDGRIEVAQRDGDFLQRVARLCGRLFNVPTTVRDKSMYFHGRMLRDFLMWCGLGFDKAPTKKIPRIILESPSVIQRAFLRGLYDTDGGVSKLIHFTTTSLRLAFEVQQMLLNLGLLSKRYQMREANLEKNRSAVYRVEITGCGDKRLFKRLVGFSIGAKSHRLEVLVRGSSVSESNVGEIPNGKHLVEVLRDGLRMRGGRNYPEAPHVSRVLSRVLGGAPLRMSHLSVLAESIPDLESVSPALFAMWDKGLFFDPVVKIEQGEADVFDLHVTDEDHAFIGNGFVNHNSQGLEYDVIVMPLVDSFRRQLQRNLLYTAVTRAKKKVILVGTPTALAAAVVNNREDLRNTLFRERLQAD
jgi:intein/homing endonuclease